jgi:tetratricopeptide (TPR) repeat protein
VYISDFGLARSTETTMAGLTRTGEIVGTPRYISPEQVQGKPADQRSDLYALGTIFFEMASGQPPFSGKSMIELMFQRVQELPLDLNALKPDLPQYFRHVVMRCLERDPDKRYATAREVLHDLESQHAVAPAPSVSLPAGRTVSITLPLPTTRRSKIGVGIALIAVIGLGGFAVRQYVLTPRNASTTVAPVPTKYVAVLPFQVVGDATTVSPLAAGVVEALSSKLFELPSLNVASPAGAQNAATRGSQAEIAHELGVTLLVTGTVQGNAENLRVTVALDDVPQGKRIWSQDFSGLSADLLTIEDQIYARLLNALNVSLTNEQTARAVSHPTENIEAYRLYLSGRNAMRGQQNVENVKAAISLFEQAAQKDPSFALAYTGISDGSVRMYRTTKESAWKDKALAAAQQARNLDDKLVEVHLSLGSAYQETGKTSEAIAELTLASELAPNSDDVLRRLGRAYLSMGRGREAVQAYEKAIKANPYYWVSFGALGNAHMRLGNYEAALVSLSKVVELDPKNVTGHNDLGAAYLMLGRFDDAASSFKKVLELRPIAETYTNLGIAYASNDKHSEAIPMFEKAVSLKPNSEQFVGNLADGYRWSGDATRAAATYDKAIGLALTDLKVNPRNTSARGNLALYYAKKGDQSRCAPYAR